LPLTDGFELVGEARYVISPDVRHTLLSVGAMWILPTRAAAAARATATPGPRAR
jgi:hypothetical protein